MPTDLARAVELLTSGGFTLAAVRGEEVVTSTERGVKPLLGLLDGGASLAGYSAADKVVGKAAAFLYVLLKVERLYAGVISQPALEVLEKHGISVDLGTLVPAIRNRANTGSCPMETAVTDADSPEEALGLIRKKLAELNGGAP